MRSTIARHMGAKIEAARKRQNMSQAELGQRVGVGQTAVCRWETGAAQPSYDNLLKLSIILETPMSRLLDDTPERGADNAENKA